MSLKKVMPWGEGQGDFVLIEESDFNPEIHEEFKEGKSKAELKAERKAAHKSSESNE